jgi:CRP-like cAMP-binding protein
VSPWSREKTVRILCRTVLFGGLSVDDVYRVAERVVRLEYAPGEVVFVAGEEPKGIYVVAGGAVRAVRQTVDGREQVLSVDYPCATFGEVPIFDRGPWFSTGMALGATSLLFIGRNDIYRLRAECPELFSRLVEVLARRVRSYADLVHTLALRDVDRRVGWFILKEAIERGVPTDAGLALELTATHQDIACRVGSVREMVTRAFGHLQKAGLIKMRGRLVTIADQARLSEYVSVRSDVRPAATS